MILLPCWHPISSSRRASFASFWYSSHTSTICKQGSIQLFPGYNMDYTHVEARLRAQGAKVDQSSCWTLKSDDANNFSSEVIPGGGRYCTLTYLNSLICNAPFSPGWPIQARITCRNLATSTFFIILRKRDHRHKKSPKTHLKGTLAWDFLFRFFAVIKHTYAR